MNESNQLMMMMEENHFTHLDNDDDIRHPLSSSSISLLVRFRFENHHHHL